MECSCPHPCIVGVLSTLLEHWVACLRLACRVSSALDTRSSSGSPVMADVGSLAQFPLSLTLGRRVQCFLGYLASAVGATFNIQGEWRGGVWRELHRLSVPLSLLLRKYNFATVTTCNRRTCVCGFGLCWLPLLHNTHACLWPFPTLICFYLPQ